MWLYIPEPICTDWQLIQSMRLWIIAVLWIDRRVLWWYSVKCNVVFMQLIFSRAHQLVCKFYSLSPCWAVDKLSIKSFCCLKPVNHMILSRGTELNRLDRAKHPEAMKKMYIIWTQQQKYLLDYAKYFFISTGYQKWKKGASESNSQADLTEKIQISIIMVNS